MAGDIPQDAIEAREELNEQIEDDFDELVSYAVVGEEKTRFVLNEICYNSLGNDDEREPFPLKYFISVPNKEKCDWNKEQQLSYLAWAVEESPFAQVFLTKDPVDIVENGAIFDVNHHPCLVIGAASLDRMRADYAHLIRGFLLLKQEGFTNEEAFFISSCFHHGTDPEKPMFRPDWWQWGGHTPLNPSKMHPIEIENFLKKAPPVPPYNPDVTMRDNVNFRGINKLWRNGEAIANDPQYRLQIPAPIAGAEKQEVRILGFNGETKAYNVSSIPLAGIREAFVHLLQHNKVSYDP